MKKLDIDKVIKENSDYENRGESDYSAYNMKSAIKQAIKEVLPEILNYMDNYPIQEPKYWTYIEKEILEKIGI